MRSEQDVLQDIIATFAKIGEHQYKIRGGVSQLEGLYRKLDELNLEYSEAKEPQSKADDKFPNKA